MNTILPLTRLSRKLLANDIVKAKCLNPTTLRNLHITSSYMKEVRLGNEIVKVGSSDKFGIVEGETTGSVHDLKQIKLFPDEETPNLLFKGIPYKELPIIDIKATSNNTIMSLSDHKGITIATHSAGVEGFKNARKGTNIAAQQAAITFGDVVRRKSAGVVRVRVQGLGAGRMAALKGLEMGGVEIVSITDSTRVSWNPPRPRKPRRL
ncbi:hypothetical protein KPH14_005177 [Odynerus spinipes]|uniref:Ribosomal protein S11 n=1 Tax=Odynerus spinipes TaxID=1348599 RepID=A0AAD9RKY8_9HYME|nr:hypothetical protein KPH14_005177 [Odynerus spinipes]